MKICEFCKSEKLLELKKTRLLDIDATLFICLDCMHVFKSGFYEISLNNINKFYQNDIYNDDKIVKWQHNEQLSFLNNHNLLEVKKTQKVLEIGAGIHGLMNHLGSNYSKYSFDLNRKVQMEMETSDVHIVECLNDLKIQFDIIILSHVFEHIIEEPYFYIINLLNLLSRNGCLFIEVPLRSYELLLSRNKKVIFDNFTVAHCRSDTCASYTSFLSRLEKDFVIQKNITFLWVCILFSRNYYKKLNHGRNKSKNLIFVFLFPLEALFRIVTSILFHLRLLLNQPYPNIKILIKNRDLNYV